MARHRSYSAEFNRQVTQEYLGGEAPGRPIYGGVVDDGESTDQRMRVKVAMC